MVINMSISTYQKIFQNILKGKDNRYKAALCVCFQYFFPLFIFRELKIFVSYTCKVEQIISVFIKARIYELLGCIKNFTNKEGNVRYVLLNHENRISASSPNFVTITILSLVHVTTKIYHLLYLHNTLLYHPFLPTQVVIKRSTKPVYQFP